MSPLRSSKGASKRIHDLLIARYIEPARRRGQPTATVAVRDIARDLHLEDRYPQICTAMEGQRFLRAHALEIVGHEGPRQSSTVTITYGLEGGAGVQSGGEGGDLMDRLYGSMREAYATAGGAEASLRRDRATFEREPGE